MQVNNAIIRGIEFEVLNNNDTTNHLILKRVLNAKKSVPEKTRREREMALPKLNIHYFEKQYIEELSKISLSVAKCIVANDSKISFYKKIIHMIFRTR